jgi:hypothetical protein
MKKFRLLKKLFLFCALLSFSSAYSQSVDCDHLIGSWHNARKSTLTVSAVDASTGQITGTYTIIGSTGPETFPLTGYVHLNIAGTDNLSTLVNFCVSFIPYKSSCSWSGYCSMQNGQPTIHTLWLLVSANANAPFNHITTDVDDFTPGAAK